MSTNRNKLVCPKCGTEMPSFANYCKYCGSELESEKPLGMENLKFKDAFSTFDEYIAVGGIMAQIYFAKGLGEDELSSWNIIFGLLGLLTPIVCTNAFKRFYNQIKPEGVGYAWIIAITIPVILAFLIGYSNVQTTGIEGFMDAITSLTSSGYQVFLLLSLLFIDLFILYVWTEVKKGETLAFEILLFLVCALISWCLPIILMGIVFVIIAIILGVVGLAKSGGGSTSSITTTNLPQKPVKPNVPDKGPLLPYFVIVHYDGSLGTANDSIIVDCRRNPTTNEIAEAIYKRTNRHGVIYLIKEHDPAWDSLQIEKMDKKTPISRF